MFRFSVSGLLILTTYLAIMLGASNWLPRFDRFIDSYPRMMYAACWIGAAMGGILVTLIKQRPYTNHSIVAFMIANGVGTWFGFWWMATWCIKEAKRSSQFPGLGAALFLIYGFVIACLAAHIAGWTVPRGKPKQESSMIDSSEDLTQS